MTEVRITDKVGTLSLADYFAWALVGLAPFLFALASWNTDGAPYQNQAFVRTFSIPITAIECIVIVFAILVGSGPVQAIARAPRWTWLLLFVLVSIALGTGYFTAASSGTALVRTYAWLIHLLFGFTLWRLLAARWWPLRPWIWPSIAAGVLLYCLILVLFVLSIPDEATFDWKRFSLGVIHIRQVGFYSVVGAAVAIGVAATANGKWNYWLAAAAAAVCLALSYWSGTRGSIVAVAASFAAGLILVPALRTVRAIGAFLVANVGGVLISFVHQPPHAFFGTSRISESTAAAASVDELTSARLHMWWLSAEAVLKRPLFGYGESQFGRAVPSFSEFNHPHNIILQAAVSWGLVGLACFLALSFVLAWRFLGAVRDGDVDLLPPFLVAGGLATMAMYEGSLYHPYPVMMMAVALAFVLSARTVRRSAQAEADSLENAENAAPVPGVHDA